MVRKKKRQSNLVSRNKENKRLFPIGDSLLLSTKLLSYSQSGDGFKIKPIYSVEIYRNIQIAGNACAYVDNFGDKISTRAE